jgi:hypothetical protein
MCGSQVGELRPHVEQPIFAEVALGETQSVTLMPTFCDFKPKLCLLLPGHVTLDNVDNLWQCAEKRAIHEVKEVVPVEVMLRVECLEHRQWNAGEVFLQGGDVRKALTLLATIRFLPFLGVRF